MPDPLVDTYNVKKILLYFELCRFREITTRTTSTLKNVLYLIKSKLHSSQSFVNRAIKKEIHGEGKLVAAVARRAIKRGSFAPVGSIWRTAVSRGAGLNQVYQRLVAVNALDRLSAVQTRCRGVIPRPARVNYTRDCRAIQYATNAWWTARRAPSRPGRLRVYRRIRYARLSD